VKLRRYAIDLGADLVINAHPHVLQGIEAYHGGFIAHSMGNFAFDQLFPETMLTISLAATLDTQHRARNLIATPIYIQGYIPRVASGELARAILDYVSELSRPMNTWVVRDPATEQAVVLPDRTAPVTTETFVDTLVLVQLGQNYYSAPFKMRGDGYPSFVRVLGAVSADVRIGSDVLHYGNMENEGAAPWDFNDEAEYFDSTVSYRGQRSLHCAVSPNGLPETTRFVYHPPLFSSQAYSLCAMVRGDSLAAASVGIRTYQSRTADVVETVTTSPLAGAFPWRQAWLNFTSRDNAHYYDIICSASGDDTDNAVFLVDDMNLVQWNVWTARQASISYPGRLRFVQARSSTAMAYVVIEYEVATIHVSP
jgi:hypothetical protein